MPITFNMLQSRMNLHLGHLADAFVQSNLQSFIYIHTMMVVAAMQGAAL